MRGKTKSFFEDTSIVMVVLVFIYGLYYLYSNYYIEENIVQPIVIIKDVKTDIIIEPKLEAKIIEKRPIQKDVNKTIIIKEIVEKQPQVIVEREEKLIPKEKKEKNVDLKILRAFLIETKFKIRKNIIYSTDTNTTIEDKSLKFKITILKDGNYEQLKFVDGNREIFELNKENILKVFPLVIDEKIVDDFPRYFRMNIK